MTKQRNRDSKGRFCKGHALPGPGRPSKATESEYVTALTSAAPPEKVAEIISTLCQLAIQEKDVKAAGLILRYVLPEKLPDAVDHGLRIAGDGSPAETSKRIFGNIVERVMEMEEREKRFNRAGYSVGRINGATDQESVGRN